MAGTQSPTAYQGGSPPSLEAGVKAYEREYGVRLPQDFFRLSLGPQVNRFLAFAGGLVGYIPPRYVMTLDQNVLATSGIDPITVSGFFEGYYSQNGIKVSKVSPQPDTIASSSPRSLAPGSIVDENMQIYCDAVTKGLQAREYEKAKPGSLEAGVKVIRPLRAIRPIRPIKPLWA